MPYLRVVSLAFMESEYRIEGDVHFSSMEEEDSHFLRENIKLHFYRPGSKVNDNEWLKDVLVQVIEQL